MKYTVQVNDVIVTTRQQYKVVMLLSDIEVTRSPAVLVEWVNPDGIRREVSLVGDARSLSELLGAAQVREKDSE